MTLEKYINYAVDDTVWLSVRHYIRWSLSGCVDRHIRDYICGVMWNGVTAPITYSVGDTVFLTTAMYIKNSSKS
jgi:dUTPase